mgnify:CR=1 FL=1
MELPPRPGVHLITLAIIGVILFSLGSYSTDLHYLFVGNKNTSGLSIFLSNQLPEFKWYGVIFLIGSIASYFISTGIESFIKDKISPLVATHVDRLSTELENVSKSTNSLLSAKLLSNIIDASPQSLVQKHIKQVHEKAFGTHCGNSHGLYTAVENKFSKFYEESQPHRSDYNQTVTVVENSEDSIVWHEVCTYKIHTISFSEEGHDTGPVPYNLRFSSTVKVAELTFEGKDPKYKLVILVEGDEIFNSERHLALSNGKVVTKEDIKGLRINHTGKTLNIELDRDYPLTKEWTHIEIKETSTIYDDYFISRRNEPTCGANINMNLPDGWSFELISFGHPDDWTIHQHPMNTLSAITKKWLFPGITFFCKWQKPEMQQLEMSE